MSDPYVGEIRMFGGTFAPAGWAFCSGQLMPISENETLFNLIGTTYGGDGQETFGLPDLQGRVPVHAGTLTGDGTTFTLGELGGNETVTLTTNQIPSHTHVPQGSTASGTSNDPTNRTWAPSSAKQFTTEAPDTVMAAGASGQTGGSQPHENMTPFLTVGFIISLFGIFPTQT